MTTQTMTEEQRLHALKAVDGSVITVGDEVIHENSSLKGEEDNTATVTGFYWDKRLGEYRANTTKGNAGLDYLSKV